MAGKQLSEQTIGLIQQALAHGPGVNNQLYEAAYKAIAAEIQAHGGFNSGTVNWFEQAHLVNVNPFKASAVGTYVWNYTIAAAKAQGVTLLDSEMRVASNAIGESVFERLDANNYFFTDVEGAANTFHPKSIVDVDAGVGLDKLRDFHPGSNLTMASWGGTLFARTQLN